MILVLLESPYAGDENEVEENVRFGRACLRDCLNRGEAPFASHLFFTQPGVLNDKVPRERQLGIEAGLAIGAQMHKSVVYTNRGISPGMELGVERAILVGRPVEYRTLPDWK